MRRLCLRAAPLGLVALLVLPTAAFGQSLEKPDAALNTTWVIVAAILVMFMQAGFAFLEAGLVDEVVAYVAPMLLGAGASAVADLGIATISDALHLHVSDVTVLQGHDGEDTNVRLTMRPQLRRS